MPPLGYPSRQILTDPQELGTLKFYTLSEKWAFLGKREKNRISRIPLFSTV
jgi:hypothetical protein